MVERQDSKLNFYAERIENFKTNVLKTGRDKRTEGFLNARIQLLHSYWKKFQDEHDSCYDTATPEQLQTLDTTIFYNIEEVYTETIGWILEQIEEIRPQTASTPEAHSSFNSPRTLHPRQLIENLPKLSLPTFKGTYLEWPSFKGTFQSLIHDNEMLTDIQKMHYLKSTVSGEAATLINHLPVTAENYYSAWDLLQARYENKRVLVNSNLKLIFSLQPMSTESYNEVRRVLDDFTQAVTQLKNLGRPVQHWDDWLVFLLANKLDNNTRKEWENSLKLLNELPTFNELSEFLQFRLRTLHALTDNVLPGTNTKTTPAKSKTIRPQTTFSRSYHTSSGKACTCCQGKHRLLFCPQFRAKSVTERLEFLHRNKLCSNCLRNNHKIQDCPSVNRCKQCQQNHHTMVHDYNSTVSSETKTQHSPASVAYHSSSSYSHKPVLLTTAIVLVQSPDGRTIRARALLDQCSESSFITTDLVNNLRLHEQTIQMPVFGIANCPAGTAEAFVNYNIRSTVYPNYVTSVQALVLPTLAHLTPGQNFQTSAWPHIKGLKLADPEFHLSSRIDLVLGVEVYTRVLRKGVRLGPEGAPIAQSTSLGWILSGPMKEDHPSNNIMLRSHCTLIDVDMTLRRFWEIEDITKKVPLTPDEEECENHFLQFHRRDNQGRYVVKLPIKSHAAPLGDSRKVAMATLLRLEKRLEHDPNLRSAYSDFMEEYLNLGHMERVSQEDENHQRQYYLPHHAVLKPNSTTTKLRVVFNGSQKSTSGISLNDQLHIGPKLQNEIFNVILKWRFYPLVFTADIEKMFRQILVDKSDADLQRILWRRSSTEPVDCYRLLTVTYGMACAPYLACKALHQLAEDHQLECPSAATIIRENFYVDDALFGAFDEQSALHAKTELRTLLSKGGFKLRKWLTNSSNLIDDIPEEDREIAVPEKLVTDSNIKTLGLKWNPATDKFTFSLHLSQIDSFTKRSILSDISRVYDPLGWLSPTTIIAKIFLQKLWLAKLDWDEEIPVELLTTWQRYRHDLSNLNNIQINRWMGTTNSHSSLELHGFCDASLNAYAAVVYLRVFYGHDNIRVSLIAAKTRVSPLKTISLPRLELCGATLLAELLAWVQQDPYLRAIPVYAWSDSTVVLSWLQEHPSKWKVFIANRVSTIHSSIPRAIWQHVRSEDNPADCSTRGLPLTELQSHDLWWTGPPWLRRDREYWPKRNLEAPPEPILEERRETTIFIAQAQNPVFTLLRSYSTLRRLLRVTAYCYRFVRNASLNPSQRQNGTLTTVEKNKALQKWINIVQQFSFTTELSDLTKIKNISPRSKLRTLTPFVDEQGLLRVGGRLKNATLSYEERYPVILPKDSHLTWLLIDDAHQKTLHGGTQLTLHYLRAKYWIQNGRSTVRHFIRRCLVCYRYKAKAKNQIMANLPCDRVHPSKPFTNSGVDYAGPFSIKPIKGRGRTIIKSYVAIFVCFSTRAIHLELVMDLTAEAFLSAFKRFVARRGHCAKLFSDNATNFVGAAKQLAQHVLQLNRDTNLIELLADGGTEWHFIPPATPHFGGLWEAGVKSLKHHFRRVVGQHMLSIEEMLTLITQIEACLNSRPLHPINDDPNDLQALTPGHFLVGGNLLTVPEPSVIDKPINRLTRWQLVHHMYEQLWQRWHKEYLHALQLRNKWERKQDPVRINDLVLIKEEKVPPSKWLLGRVVDVHPGDDGNIRVVTLKHKNGYSKRPIVKLCVLPTNDDPEQN